MRKSYIVWMSAKYFPSKLEDYKQESTELPEDQNSMHENSEEAK